MNYRPWIHLFGSLLAPAAQRFHRSLQDPETAQRRVQQQIGDRLIASDYGKAFGIRSIDDWQRVPIVEYDDLLPWIRQGSEFDSQNEGAKGAKNFAEVNLFCPKSPLTPEPILFHERTSGTSGVPKWIPYTRSLRRSFNHAFCVWAYDLIRHGAPFTTGKLYFCISPQFPGAANEPLADQLADDSQYLDRWLQWMLRPFWVSLPNSSWRSVEEFKWQLAVALLQAADLEIISIWSPSFLTVMLEYIQTHRHALRRSLRLSAQRDRLLQAAEISWAAVWSNLKLISCWDSATAADSASGLRSQFPGVLVQGKGLLATEAPITIPLIAANGYVPVLDHILFELEAEDGAVCWLHQGRVGKTYTLILSQTGGLYRYRLGDRVRVTHFYQQTPCLEFVGRGKDTSDLVGEKLHAAFVADVLQHLNLAATFQTLVAATQPFRYILLLDNATESAAAIAQQLDRLLCESPHYRHARLLGQLAAPNVFVSPQIPAWLTAEELKAGKTWGDIKHSQLRCQPIVPAQLAPLTALATDRS